MRERSSSGLGAVCSSVLMRVWRNWAEEVAWWCVVDGACGVSSAVSTAEVVMVFACVFFWGVSAGMVFSLSHQFFVRASFFPSLSHKKALHYVCNPWVVWVYKCGDPWLKS